MQKRTFITSVLGVSSVMLIVNISSLCYTIFMSQRAGSEAIGVYHLVMSIYSFASCVSVSGISLTATRLISDMPIGLSHRCADDVVRKCIKLVLVPSSLCFCLLFFGSSFIADKILKNPDAALCLKILAPCLVFNSVVAVIDGYFTAFGKAGAISLCLSVKDLSMWISTFLYLYVFGAYKIYLVIVLAFFTSALTDFLISYYLWHRAKFHLYCHDGTDYSGIIRLCAPLAVGSYLRTGLGSLENILIPKMLALFGELSPLGIYGILKGMTMPLIMFPMILMSGFTSFIVPEIAKRRALNYKNGIKYISSLSIEYVLDFAFFVAAFIFKWHDSMASLFFGEKDAGVYLGYLSLFPVFLFLDSACDSILKGMDEQNYSLKINVVDAACRVLFILFLIPRFGIGGYIAIMYISEIINLIFSYLRLRLVTRLSFPFKNGVAAPGLSALLALWATKKIVMPNMLSSMLLFAAIFIISVYFLKTKK